jgi:hypothetical protein
MVYRQLGRSGLRVSALTLVTAALAERASSSGLAGGHPLSALAPASRNDPIGRPQPMSGCSDRTCEPVN